MDQMPRCYTLVTFQQVQNETPRNPLLQLQFGFVSGFEAEDSWADQTRSGSITFPKNIYAIDPQTNQPVGLGGFNDSDKWVTNLFNKGDSVSITYGYYRYDTSGNEILDVPQNPVFTGYITRVNSKKPLKTLLTNLLAGTAFTVNMLTPTIIGDLEIQNQSVAQVLEKLRSEYHLESYFRGNELRVGSQVYVEGEANTYTFVFQKNIISDELTFQRQNDLKLSMICESLNQTFPGGSNKAGQTKSALKRLTVLVYNDKGKWKYMKKDDNTPFPDVDEGERRSLIFNGYTDAQALAQAGLDELAKYYYTGFKGKFTTFAVPCVKQGDNVNLVDPVMPDRNGVFKVRSVKYTGGINGHRQVIELDYKLYVVNNSITTPPPLQLAS
jgi:hypothetical protein